MSKERILQSIERTISNKGICVLCVVVLFSWIFFASCKKEEIQSNPVPFLKIESVTPTTITQFLDSVVVVLTYDDGDGDLGFDHPDSSALEVLDSRLPYPDYYFVKPLAPVGETLHIRGTLRLELTSPFLLGNGGDEIIQYSIRIKDRSGNWSNTVITPDITVQQ